MIEPFIANIVIFLAIYVILAVSLNFALGYAGLLNLAHIAFFGIGAYTSALLTINGVPFVAAFIVAGFFASIAAILVTFATKKLKGDYLALATLAFSFVVFTLFNNLQTITRGPLGLPGIPKPEFFGFKIITTDAYLIFTIVLAVISVIIINRIIKSPFGRVMQAMRDDEIGLRVLGKDTYLIKYKVMAVSAFFAGIAGSLFAHYISFIDPTSFRIHEIVLVLTMVIVGGIASMRGALLGAVIASVIPELLRFVALAPSVLGPARVIIYTLILLAILMYKPRGIFGRVDLK